MVHHIQRCHPLGLEIFFDVFGRKLLARGIVVGAKEAVDHGIRGMQSAQQGMQQIHSRDGCTDQATRQRGKPHRREADRKAECNDAPQARITRGGERERAVEAFADPVQKGVFRGKIA